MTSLHPAGGQFVATPVPSGLRDRGERGSVRGVAGGNELWPDRRSGSHQNAVVFDPGGSGGAGEGLPAQARKRTTSDRCCVSCAERRSRTGMV
jgi:hypothetical protein